MIKLKTEVNKSAIMRDLHNEAVEIYKNAYEGEYAIKQFLYGAEMLFKKLRQPPVSRRSEQCNHIFQRVERGAEFQGNQCECGEWEDLT